MSIGDIVWAFDGARSFVLKPAIIFDIQLTDYSKSFRLSFFDSPDLLWYDSVEIRLTPMGA